MSNSLDEKDDIGDDHKILDTIYYGKDGRVIVVYWVIEKEDVSDDQSIRL